MNDNIFHSFLGQIIMMRMAKRSLGLGKRMLLLTTTTTHLHSLSHSLTLSLPQPPPHFTHLHPSSSYPSPFALVSFHSLAEKPYNPPPSPPSPSSPSRSHPFPFPHENDPPWSDIALDVQFPQEFLVGTSSPSSSSYSSSSSSVAVESIGFDSGRVAAPLPHRQPPASSGAFCEPADVYIPVKAVFVSRQINLKTLAEEEFSGTIFSRNNLIIRWEDRPHGSPPKPGLLTTGSWSSARYMVAFSYGSVVFFNFGEKEEDECVSVVKKHCMNLCEEAKTEDFDILVRPTLDGWILAGHDKVILKKLNTENIRIVASVLGQSIALEQYGRQVDQMVSQFSEMNQVLSQTGKFQMQPEELFKLVAHANTTLAEVLLNLAILERSDAAWKHANYAALWEYLREEFELVQRFEFFGFKNDIIRHNVGFFLDVLQNKKSDTLEWTVIVLIGLEICVSSISILHQFGFL